MKIWHKTIILAAVSVLFFSIPIQAIPSQLQNSSHLDNKTPLELIEILEDVTLPQRLELQRRLLDDVYASIPVFRSKILTGTRGQKLFCCAMIAEIRDTDSVSVLLEAMDDPDDKVKIRAISSLRILKAKQALGRIRKGISKTENRGIIKVSLAGLAALGGPSDIAVLEKFLSHADESVRIVAAGGIALLGDYQAQDILLAGTDSNSPIAKKEATYLLGFVNTAKAKERLQDIINDPDGQWKSYAKMALAQHELRNRSIARQLDILEALTSDKNQRVGQWAVEKLADMNSPQGNAILRKVEKYDNRSGRKAKRILSIRGVK